MEIMVTGSRTWSDYQLIYDKLKWILDVFGPFTLLSGHASKGADLLAEQAANALKIPWQAFPAEWGRHGGCSCSSKAKTCRYAGLRRNLEMLDRKPSLVLGFWVEGSTGTRHAMQQALRRGISVHVTLSNGNSRMIYNEKYFK